MGERVMRVVVLLFFEFYNNHHLRLLICDLQRLN